MPYAHFWVSFVGPGFLYLLFLSGGDRRQRLRHLAIATITASALISPYLVNCWRVYGDPLYALNYEPLRAPGVGTCSALDSAWGRGLYRPEAPQ